MKNVFALLFVAVIALSSCNNSKNDNGKKRVAKGQVTYGGTLRITEVEPYQTLYPYNIVDLVSFRIAYQIYEGLLRYNTKNLSIEPSIAEKWEIADSGKTYIFHLRKGVFFHDDASFKDGIGREVTANDFKYSFQLLCTYTSKNQAFAKTFKDRVKGATEYFEASKKGKPSFDIAGVKVIDANTLKIELNYPSQSFLSIMALPSTSVIPQEAFEKYGDKIKVGTGPFILKDSINSKKQITLVRNPKYYRFDTIGNQLPYIDTVLISYVDSKDKVFDMFKKGKIDIVTGIQSEATRDIVQENIAEFKSKDAKFVVNQISDVITFFIEFNTTNKDLKNDNLRKAISLAIDKKKIIKKILNIEDYSSMGAYGITPITSFFLGYDTIKSLDYNPAKAKELLAKSGIKGKSLNLRLLINTKDKENTVIAQEIYNQLKSELDINVTFYNENLDKQTESANKGDFDMILTSFAADYASPEAFLWLFYGKEVPASATDFSYPNVARYKNAEFDKNYEAGVRAKTKEESFKFFAKSEKQLINDAVIIPIWYPENFKLLQSNVQGFYFNPLKYADYSHIYFKAAQPKVK